MICREVWTVGTMHGISPVTENGRLCAKAGVEQEDQEKESKSAACEGVWRADCDVQGDTT